MRVADLDAWVLCGGEGLRLRSTIRDVPKVLAPVAGRPFLEIVLDGLRSQGVDRYVLCAGYRADAIRAALPRLRTRGQVSISVEARPLGTGGALRRALDQGKSDPLLALNGDSICRVDLREMLRTHRECGARATLALAPTIESQDYGAVQIDADGRVERFAEKQTLGPGLASAGIYLIERALLEALPPEPFSLETDLFPMLAAERGLYAHVCDAPFVDIGTPERYAEAARTLEALGLL
ncbi:MAG: nucleotidyltransferase family protein [Myxococcota bacterium]